MDMPGQPEISGDFDGPKIAITDDGKRIMSEEEEQQRDDDETSQKIKAPEHEALRACVARLSLFTFLAVPVVVLLVSTVVGGVLSAVEDWPYKDGFLYVGGQITGGTNPLVLDVPESTTGKVVSLLIGVWGVGLLSLAIALVGGHILDPIVDMLALGKPDRYVPELRARKQIVKIGAIKYGGLKNFLKKLDSDDTAGLSAEEFKKIADYEGILKYLDIEAISLLFEEMAQEVKGRDGNIQLQVEHLQNWLTDGYKHSKLLRRKQLRASILLSLVFILITMSLVIFMASVFLGVVLLLIEEFAGNSCDFTDGFYFVAAIMTASQNSMTQWQPSSFLSEFFTVIIGAIAVGVLSILVGLVGGGVLKPVAKSFSLHPSKDNFWKDVSQQSIPQEILLADYLLR
ncbi:hypothetical protein CYMTET_46118 [Cymbomonas tetramitiformis]|uniref:EF-hand domain-containing protein n=1 Tax=Cymbomonas tetramitiformis TaxID=36881 RepID=A0AAE0BWT0_9CHLO|nr:hypothetical protein CYMTET_46118 [Cymbomonas tetramitiformis]